MRGVNGIVRVSRSTDSAIYGQRLVRPPKIACSCMGGTGTRHLEPCEAAASGAYSLPVVFVFVSLLMASRPRMWKQDEQPFRGWTDA